MIVYMYTCISRFLELFNDIKFYYKLECIYDIVSIG